MIGSLTARIFAIFWLTLALVLMLVLMLPKLDSRQMTELLESEQRQGIMIEQHVEAELANDPPNDLMWWRRLFRAIDKWAPPGQRLLLVTSEGRVIGAERNEMQIIRNFIGQADNADHPQKKRYGRLEMVGPFSVRDGEDNYQLYLIRPANTSQSDFINLLFDRPLLLLIVTMLVSAPLLLWLAWSLAKPARKLKNAADEVAQGNLRQHPELEAGPQEFLAAGTSFNQMVTALERMMSSQHRLLSDISHELRTPLAVLRGELEAIQDGIRKFTPDSIASLQAEVATLTKLVDDLHQLSMSDEGALSYQKSAVDIINLLEVAAGAFRERFASRGLSIGVSLPESATVFGDRDRLMQLFNNLLENSLRYTDSGGGLQISASQSGDRLILDFADSAPGVTDEQLERLVERFYRTEGSRNRASGGSGLGLAICLNIVAAHGGTLRVGHSPLGGVSIKVELPLERNLSRDV